MDENSKLYQQWLREVKEEPSNLSIGMRDLRGNLLVLGGQLGNLWLLKNGLFSVNGEVSATSSLAIEAYNKLNGTKLPLTYVEDWFLPWFEKQLSFIEVPSATNPGISYKVRKEPGGTLSCECKGFRYRGDCWHVQAVKELASEES